MKHLYLTLKHNLQNHFKCRVTTNFVVYSNYVNYRIWWDLLMKAISSWNNLHIILFLTLFLCGVWGEENRRASEERKALTTLVSEIFIVISLLFFTLGFSLSLWGKHFSFEGGQVCSFWEERGDFILCEEVWEVSLYEGEGCDYKFMYCIILLN